MCQSVTKRSSRSYKTVQQWFAESSTLDFFLKTASNIETTDLIPLGPMTLFSPYLSRYSNRLLCLILDFPVHRKDLSNPFSKNLFQKS
jgi:hypothetical protein